MPLKYVENSLKTTHRYFDNKYHMLSRKYKRN